MFNSQPATFTISPAPRKKSHQRKPIRNNGHPSRRAPLSQRLQQRNRNNGNAFSSDPPAPQIMSHSMVLKAPSMSDNMEIYELLPDPNS